MVLAVCVSLGAPAVTIVRNSRTLAGTTSPGTALDIEYAEGVTNKSAKTTATADSCITHDTAAYIKSPAYSCLSGHF